MQNEHEYPPYEQQSNGSEIEIQTRILNFFYSCSRQQQHSLDNFTHSFNDLFSFIHTNIHIHSIKEKYIQILFCLTCYVRDKKGKGERDLSYRMIEVFHRHYPELAKQLIGRCVGFDENQTIYKRPYGSWKDIKYFCNFIYTGSENPVDPLIEYCIELVSKQLQMDIAAYEVMQSGSGDEAAKISLCAKWIPREKSNKFGWLFRQIAVRHIPTYYLTAKSQESAEKAYRKTFAEFSKILSRLNRQLDTLQIQMCAKNWAEIRQSNVPYYARFKHKWAFLNKAEYIEPDRIQCAENFQETYQESHRRIGKLNGLCKPIHDAHCLWNSNRYADNKTMEMDVFNINAMWDKWMGGVEDGTAFTYMVPVLDQSPSLSINYSIPLYTATALSLMISRHSIIKDRLLTFSRNPKWIFCKNTLYETLCEIIRQGYICEVNINFYKIYKLLLDACIDKHISEENVGKLMITVFTNTHIHMADVLFDEMMYSRILTMYQSVGYRYLPNILYWDLTKNDIPCMYKEKCGVTIYMMTGYNDYVVNSFCKYGAQSLYDMEPFESLSAKIAGYQ